MYFSKTGMVYPYRPPLRQLRSPRRRRSLQNAQMNLQPWWYWGVFEGLHTDLIGMLPTLDNKDCHNQSKKVKIASTLLIPSVSRKQQNLNCSSPIGVSHRVRLCRDADPCPPMPESALSLLASWQEPVPWPPILYMATSAKNCYVSSAGWTWEHQPSKRIQ